MRAKTLISFSEGQFKALLNVKSHVLKEVKQKQQEEECAKKKKKRKTKKKDTHRCLEPAAAADLWEEVAVVEKPGFLNQTLFSTPPTPPFTSLVFVGEQQAQTRFGADVMTAFKPESRRRPCLCSSSSVPTCLAPPKNVNEGSLTDDGKLSAEPTAGGGVLVEVAGLLSLSDATAPTTTTTTTTPAVATDTSSVGVADWMTGGVTSDVSGCAMLEGADLKCAGWDEKTVCDIESMLYKWVTDLEKSKPMKRKSVGRNGKMGVAKPSKKACLCRHERV